MVTVDEVSMCGADKLYEIHRRLCEILISEDLFANKAVMFVGDLMQVKNKTYVSKIYISVLSLFFHFIAASTC